ncbi:MAG: ROK family protein, partial [Leptospiraceae bacterium]|nr:ROK family protein [Leptospiraceae bacterium]
IPCLNGVSVTAEIKKNYDLPVYIDNDATNAAKGMYRFGAGRGSAHMIGITLGTGVGGGIILHGQVHRGIINYAGEIGHITYIPDGMSCTCGKRGCLEAYASATAIVRSAQSILKRQIPSRLQKYPPDEITARVVCDEARKGCSVSASIIQDAGKALGVVIGGVINLLNLDRVVIGGGLAAAGEVLMEPVRLYASRHALPLAFERCEIVAGRLGNDAGLLGCAASVLMARDGTNHLSP